MRLFHKVRILEVSNPEDRCLMSEPGAKVVIIIELCKKKREKVMFGGYFLSLGSGKVNFSDKRKIAERGSQNVRKSIVKTQRKRQTAPVGESRSSLDPRISDTTFRRKENRQRIEALPLSG